MLQERSRRLQAQLAEYTQLRAANDAVEAYQTRLKQVKAVADRLRPLIQTYEVLRRHGISIDSVADMTVRIQPRLCDLRDRYQADVSIIIPPEAMGRLPQELTSLTERLQSQLMNAWTRYIGEQLTEVSESFLTLFDRIPEAQMTVQRIRRLRSQLAILRGRLPRLDQEISDFLTAVEQQKVFVRELDGFPQPVIAFLRAAASGGAELELLTEEVQQWLTERGMKHAFRILAR